MGTNYNVHLGPFLEFRTRLTVTTTPACPSPDACPKATSKHCPECGLKTPVGTKPAEIESPEIDWEPLLDALTIGLGLFAGERYSKAGMVTYRLVPSGYKSEQDERYFGLDAKYDEAVDEVDPLLVDAEKAWFAEKFAAEIGALKNAGALDISVKWGLMVWQS